MRGKLGCELEVVEKVRCKRCHGRGFYLKPGGYTSADRIKCIVCGGVGRVPTVSSSDSLHGIVHEDWLKDKPPLTKRESLYRRYGVEC